MHLNWLLDTPLTLLSGLELDLRISCVHCYWPSLGAMLSTTPLFIFWHHIHSECVIICSRGCRVPVTDPWEVIISLAFFPVFIPLFCIYILIHLAWSSRKINGRYSILSVVTFVPSGTLCSEGASVRNIVEARAGRSVSRLGLRNSVRCFSFWFGKMVTEITSIPYGFCNFGLVYFSSIFGLDIYHIGPFLCDGWTFQTYQFLQIISIHCFQCSKLQISNWTAA